MECDDDVVVSFSLCCLKGLELSVTSNNSFNIQRNRQKNVFIIDDSFPNI